MKSTVFANLSEQRKSDVRQFYDNWARAGHKLDLLEEGLRYLSSPSREPATSIIGIENGLADICCAYGKGPRPKLSLTKRDASLLLTLVVEIRKAGAADELTSEMIGRAFSMIIEGRSPNGQSDPASRRLADILGASDPGLKQGSLF